MNNFAYRLKRFLYQEFIPVTKGIAIVSGAIFLIGLLFRQLNALIQLAPGYILNMPWTVLTFPFANNDILGIIFGILWLWMIGGELERSWGSKSYGLFVFLVALATGVAMGGVGFLWAKWISIGGIWLPLLGITWAWAENAPDREVQFWGIIPIKARWLAWIEAVITFCIYAQYNILLGLASLAGILVAYLFLGKNPLKRRGYGYGGWNRGYGKGQSNRARRNKFRVIK
ncbi:MAG: rhomboid family intramembrane serine protease [Firmicutes bacterium]|nr:rhomboid family intramembrane serine protease [Bacillota bacterium]